MEQAEKLDACGNPLHERSLLPTPMLSKWAGLPVGWLDIEPHTVNADIVTERNVLVMIDQGVTQADFRYGARAMSCEFKPDSIGFFPVGTELKPSRWKWARTRRIFLDLDADLHDGSLTADGRRNLPRVAQFEFRDGDLAAVVRSMANEIARGCPHGRLFAESLSIGVSMRMHQRAAAHQAGVRERGKLTAAQVAQVQELVRSRPGDSIALADMARLVGFSTAQFVRLFRNTMACTPYQYVLKLRLNRARELVLTSGLALADIADETGFASQSHMTAAFVRAWHAPPGAMRRHRKSGNAQ